MRDERRAAAPRGRVHHRRFDFEITACDEEFAHCLNHPGARFEHALRFGIRDQIEITLAVFGFLVGQTVELLGKGRNDWLAAHAGGLER